MRPRPRRRAGEASSRTWPSASIERASSSASSFCAGNPARASASAAPPGRWRAVGAEAPRRLQQRDQRGQVAASATEPGTRAASSVGRTSDHRPRAARRSGRSRPAPGESRRARAGSRPGSVRGAGRPSPARAPSGCAPHGPEVPAPAATRARRCPVESRNRSGACSCPRRRQRRSTRRHGLLGGLVARPRDRLRLVGDEWREHVVGHALAVLAGRPGRPTPILTRRRRRCRRPRSASGTPLWPPALPSVRTRTLPRGRSMSSKTITRSADRGVAFRARRATGGPVTFMKSCPA
jgi:hypothetical protein